MSLNIDYKKFGSTIRHLRLEKNFTQQNICDIPLAPSIVSK